MHPHHEHRQHKVERSRVGHITKGYAKGGAVRGEKGLVGKVLAAHKAEHEALHAEGKSSKHRMDRPKRAKGGRVGKSKGNARTIVNVITGGHPAGGAVPPPPPMGIAGPPPGAMPAPPMAAKPPMPMLPPGAGMTPGGPPMPMRAKGGRVNQGSHVWEEGKHAGTKVQHSDGKGTANRPENLNRGKPVTFKSGGRVRSFYARGGKIESPQGVANETRLPGGSGGGEARLVKAKRAGREYHGPA